MHRCGALVPEETFVIVGATMYCGVFDVSASYDRYSQWSLCARRRAWSRDSGWFIGEAAHGWNHAPLSRLEDCLSSAILGPKPEQ